MTDPLKIISSWFSIRGWKPFKFQKDVWNAYLEGYSGLIHSATGTGKTYAAWIGPLIEHIKNNKNTAGKLQVIWITPIRALSADIMNALALPVYDMKIKWRVESRTGDTSSAQKTRQKKNSPEALVTTPESLSLLLSQKDSKEFFSNIKCVIVDEWHELLSSKRGTQVELALARLRKWNPDLRTWGISATIGNLDIALKVLLGSNFSSSKTKIITGYSSKKIIVDTLLPDNIERFPWAGHIGLKMLPKVIDEIEKYNSVIIFTNVRSQTEFWYQELLELRPDWAGIIALHHGSLDRDVRDHVELGLKTGRLKCVISTSSLDLGVDFSPVDRVMQVGSPKGIARLLQRAGRSGHQPGAVSRITCVPSNVLEIIEIAAVRESMKEKKIESRYPVEKPLDVLIQHVVTIAMGGGFYYNDLYNEVRTSYSYRDLTLQEWDWVLDFVTKGGNVLEAYPEYSKVIIDNGCYKVENRKIAHMHRMSIGTIVSDASLAVRYLKGGRLGTVEESFIAKLKPGDKFIFAGKALIYLKLRDMIVYVKNAPNMKGAIPRWYGGRLPLSSELSDSIRRRLDEAERDVFNSIEMKTVFPILKVQSEWSAIPKYDELLIEKLRTNEGFHIFMYTFEGRLVHEGLAALFAYRISKIKPISFSMAYNDYGLELLSPDPVPLDEAVNQELFSNKNLLDDIRNSLNSVEMGRRQFREVARIAGLIFQGYPGSKKTVRQIQASSGLFYDVFAKYDPDNLLLHQANREVLENQLEQERMSTTLERISKSKLLIVETEKPSPLAFPILVDSLRDKLSSERFEDRVRKMQLQLEREAG